MSASLNKVMLIGRVGKDPVVRQNNYGAFCNLALATDSSYTSKNGEKVERTEWHNIVLSGKNAENAERLLKKGTLVYVEGSLSSRKWEDKGVEKTIVEIKCNIFQCLSKIESSSSQYNNQNNQYNNKQNTETPETMDELPF